MSHAESFSALGASACGRAQLGGRARAPCAAHASAPLLHQRTCTRAAQPTHTWPAKGTWCNPSNNLDNFYSKTELNVNLEHKVYRVPRRAAMGARDPFPSNSTTSSGTRL
jgi:hypothetical protein